MLIQIPEQFHRKICSVNESAHLCCRYRQQRHPEFLHKPISNGKVIDADKEYAVAEDYRKKLKTKCPSFEQNVGNLSGGNQQKVLLAKWMFTEPDILILDEPTRGIDVGAKYEIYCIINDLVAAGKSVIMISSELPEVLGMSDRIYIMNEGKFVGEVGKEEATSELIMSKIVKSGKGA